MSASAVHFRGIDCVIHAYESNKVGPWAIENGKIIMFSSEGVANDDVSEGSDQLRDVLKMLAAGGTESKFTLKTYRLKGTEEITSATGYFRAFNFSLFSADDEMMPYARRSNTYATQMNERLDRLESMLVAVVEKQGEIVQEEDEEKVGGVMGFFNGLLENPQVQGVIGRVAMGWVAKLMPEGMPLGAVGNVQPPPAQGGSVLKADQPAKVQQALNILVTCDPDLGDNLLKIAAIARDTPKKYATFAAML
jgi:hypothetical protein